MSELSELREAVARIDTNVDWIRSAMDHQVRRVDKLEDRQSKVEGRQWWLSGLWAGLGALLGIGGYHGLKP